VYFQIDPKITLFRYAFSLSLNILVCEIEGPIPINGRLQRKIKDDGGSIPSFFD
jgi:hypothetical protein